MYSTTLYGARTVGPFTDSGLPGAVSQHDYQDARPSPRKEGPSSRCVHAHDMIICRRVTASHARMLRTTDDMESSLHFTTLSVRWTMLDWNTTRESISTRPAKPAHIECNRQSSALVSRLLRLCLPSQGAPPLGSHRVSHQGPSDLMTGAPYADASGLPSRRCVEALLFPAVAKPP